MLRRYQLPVASPVSLRGLMRGTTAVFTRDGFYADVVEAHLLEKYDAHQIILTDSGTSALTLALSAACTDTNSHPDNQPTVAMPAYACADLITAAQGANVSIRLYDTDPHTLSPDLESIARIMSGGTDGKRSIDAIVVAPLFGYPVDTAGVRTVVGDIPIIEDAAQAAGGTLNSTRIGAIGDFAVLSFGRGKGTTAGGGGALLVRNTVSHPDQTLSQSRGIKNLLVTFAIWIIGRPATYSIPANIPMLRLGETVYKTPSPVSGLSKSGIGILSRSLEIERGSVNKRKENANSLQRAFSGMKPFQRGVIEHISPVSGGESGYLRLPMLLTDSQGTDMNRHLHAGRSLGITRGYPKTLDEYPEIVPLLKRDDQPLSGAKRLASELITLPTHHFLNSEDLNLLKTWLLNIES